MSHSSKYVLKFHAVKKQQKESAVSYQQNVRNNALFISTAMHHKITWFK